MNGSHISVLLASLCAMAAANAQSMFRGDATHSGRYARFGHEGRTATADQTTSAQEPGHPLKHEFTRAIPSSQFIGLPVGVTMTKLSMNASSIGPCRS